MESFEAGGEKPPTTPESRLLSLLVKRAELLAARAETVHVDGNSVLGEAKDLREEAKELALLAKPKKGGGIGVSQEAVEKLSGALAALEKEVEKMEAQEADL